MHIFLAVVPAIHGQEIMFPELAIFVIQASGLGGANTRVH